MDSPAAYVFSNQLKQNTLAACSHRVGEHDCSCQVGQSLLKQHEIKLKNLQIPNIPQPPSWSSLPPQSLLAIPEFQHDSALRLQIILCKI